MREISVFDIIGPIMIGPSSSHTAGALRIARVAGALAQKKIVDVRFKLYGSFAKTYLGHGTDRALVAGILGFDTGDYRIRDSFHWAKEAGLAFSFEEIDGVTDFHPNTVEIFLTQEDGTVNTLRGASIGGGEIEVSEIDGCEIQFSGKNNAVVVHQEDKPGVISEVTDVFKKHGVNIARMGVFRQEHKGSQVSILEVDGELDDAAMRDLNAEEHVSSAIYIKTKE